MTQQQKKFVLIAGAVVVVSFAVRSFMNTQAQNAYVLQVVRQRQEAQVRAKAIAEARAAVAKKGGIAHQQAPDGSPASATFTGLWQGSTALKERGICGMHLEIAAQDEHGQFTGYSMFNCAAKGLMVASARPKGGGLALERFDPQATVLTGTTQSDGSLSLRAEKTFANAGACVPTAISLTPFGKGRMAATWQETGCQGGYVLLQKSFR